MLGRRRNKIVHLDQAPADKVPPHSNEAEMAVLGAMMLDREAASKAMQILSAEAFYRETHRIIYQAMTALAERNQPIDIITLNDELRRMGKLGDVGGSHYLSELNMRTPTSANVEHHARIIFEKALKRRMIAAAMEIMGNCYSEGTDAFEELDRAEQQIFEISESRGSRNYHSMKRLAIDTVEMLETISARYQEGGGVVGVPSGLVKVDAMTGGFQKSDMVIIAARPSMGKTGMALSVARNAAIDYKKGVAFFSLEMAAQQLVLRLISAEAKVDAHRLRMGNLKDDDWQRIVSTIHRLTEAPLYIDDTPALGIMELRARARLMKREHNIEMIVIDYLQLMHAPKAESREREIGMISRGLKQLAKELDIPIIALSQLNRSVESRGDKRPMLSDLRESGCLTGDTLVALADSGRRVPIRELAGKKDFAVWALDETSGELRRSIVSNAFSTGVKRVFRMTTALGRTIRATGNHKFLASDGWRRLDEIEPGMKIAAPRALRPGRESSMGEVELSLLAHLVANGTLLYDNTLCYTTCDVDLARLVCLMAAQQFGLAARTAVRSDGVLQRVDIRAARATSHSESAPLEWLAAHGLGRLRPRAARVPESVFAQPVEGIATFVRHLWASGGVAHVVRGEGAIVAYEAASRELALDVQSLLLRLGINAVVRPAIEEEGESGGRYLVTVEEREEMLRFAFVVGAAGSRMMESHVALVQQLTDVADPSGRNAAVAWHRYMHPVDEESGRHSRVRRASEPSSGAMPKAMDRPKLKANVISIEAAGESGSMGWDTVVSIEPEGMEEVFDLTVPGPHNFVAADIIVHNSIEQDADVVMFVHRPEYYGINVDEDGMPTEGTAEIIIGKQRNGPTGIAKTAFVREYARFENLAFQYDNAPQYLPPSDTPDAPF